MAACKMYFKIVIQALNINDISKRNFVKTVVGPYKQVFGCFIAALFPSCNILWLLLRPAENGQV